MSEPAHPGYVAFRADLDARRSWHIECATNESLQTARINGFEKGADAGYAAILEELSEKIRKPFYSRGASLGSPDYWMLRTNRNPSSTFAMSAAFSARNFSARSRLSTVSNCDTLTTESLGSPE